jgi:putrescine transport system ATP-binding protein
LNPRPYVRLEGVSKKFGGAAAVDGVTLDIHRAEIFCLLGASGCGKTTLLRLLAGFETPDTGRIVIDGQDMARVPPYERPVNMMFQSYALFPHMTVMQNVAFGLKQERMPRGEIEARVAEMLALVKLEELAKRKPHQLSGGQRQRVALARALVKRPKLLLLDEPLGSLDKQLREHTQFELMKLQARLGVTFVVVTHDQEEAMTLATRIGVMNRGRIVQVGTPREIYESPRTRFTAEFIGSVNLFEGRVVAAGEVFACGQGTGEPAHTLIESEELGGLLRTNSAVEAAPGAVVWACVRPESVMLSRDTDDVRALSSVGGPAASGMNAAESGTNAAAGGMNDAFDAHGLPHPEASEAARNDAACGAACIGTPANAARGVVRETAYRGGLSTHLVEIESGKTVRVTEPSGYRGAAGPFAPGDRVSLSWHSRNVVVVTG